MVASDRISTYDVVHPTPIPDKGRVLTGPVGAVVRADAGHRAQPLRLRHRRRARGAARPRAARAAAGDAAGRVRRARLPLGLGLEGLPARRARSPASSCRPACASPTQLPEPIFTPSTKADDRPRRGDRLRRARPSWSASAELAERLRDVSIAVYSAIAEHALRARRDPGRHEVRVRARRATACCGSATRSARPTPRASGRPTSTSPGAASRRSTSSTCATGPPARAGTRRPPAPAIPDDVVAQTRERYVTRVRAAGRRAVRGVGWSARPVRARVLIRPKAGILDPQGQAVERALPALGFEGVAQCPRRPAGRARRRGSGAAARDVRAAARQPLDRGLRDPRPALRGSCVKFGVVRFPGSCDERRRAAGRAAGSARRSCSGTPTATCGASTR